MLSSLCWWTRLISSKSSSILSWILFPPRTSQFPLILNSHQIKSNPSLQLIAPQIGDHVPRVFISNVENTQEEEHWFSPIQRFVTSRPPKITQIIGSWYHSPILIPDWRGNAPTYVHMYFEWTTKHRGIWLWMDLKRTGHNKEYRRAADHRFHSSSFFGPQGVGSWTNWNAMRQVF